ncbi:MAG: F0F1 ATP synthase subunit A [Flavobacteriaceae bacterium]|nr:MAG: F0F1 ATP synthase subunit A [Flavobacteriaceae bacterium]
MLISIYKTLLVSFFLITPLSVFSTEKDRIQEKPFNTSELIFHHIKDSHGFHIAGHISMPLPVILWTDKGLVTFMSGEFHHDTEGKTVVTKKGLKFVNIHEKIYQLNEGATTVEFGQESRPLNATRPIDFSITKNVFSLFLSIIVMLLVFLTVAKSYKKSTTGLPTGIGKFMEPIILFIRDEVAIPNIGKKYNRYMPFLLTLFFFIWLNNIFGLIPFFPFSSNLSGNIAFTMTLAAVTFIITLFSSKKYYWKHMLWMPGLPIPMKLFLAPIEFMGMFIKPIALTIRLFANITAGHIIVLSLVSLTFIFQNYIVGAGSVLFVVFISIIEVLVVAIQAYIFTMLSALYFGQALEEVH